LGAIGGSGTVTVVSGAELLNGPVEESEGAFLNPRSDAGTHVVDRGRPVPFFADCFSEGWADECLTGLARGAAHDSR
jgi:hypothetical protein